MVSSGGCGNAHIEPVDVPESNAEDDYMSTPLERMVEFVVGLDRHAVPPEVLHDAGMKVLNILGVSIAAGEEEEGSRLKEVIARQGGASQSSVIGTGLRLPAANAALINGALGHSLDFDDTHPESIIHPSSFLTATALAVAEERGVDGTEALVGFVAGMECVVRIGMAAPGGLHARGFHATGVCGALGAAIAAGKIMGLTQQQLVNAVGIAGSMGSGIFEYLKDGSWVKPLHPGWAAHAGITAAMLAEAGFDGPSTVLEGPHGVLRTHADPPFHMERLTEGLGTVWQTLNALIKPFPCGHIMHPFITATLDLRDSEQIGVDGVEAVVCTIDKWAVPIVCEPADSKAAPETAYHSKFSLPFTIASALVDGRVDVDTYTDARVRDEEVLRLAACVGYEAKDGWDADEVLARVDLRTVDGRHLSRTQAQAQMADEEIVEKFRSLTRKVLGDDGVDRVLRGVLKLEHAGSVTELLASTSVDRAR